MTQNDYTPITPGASPDNPIPTKQYDSAEEVHPNRQDYEEMRKAQRAMQYGEPKSFVDKLEGGIDWIITLNNHIHFKAWMWIIFFGGFWMAMVIQMVWLPASLSEIYTVRALTFDLGLVVQLLDLYGVLVMMIFPAYVFTYGVLSIYEALKRRREYKEAIERQAKFGG